MRGSIASFSNSLTTSRSRSSVSLSETDISVYRSASVTEIEPTAGRLFVRSRFPQYLIRAIFGCALAVARIAKILAGYVIQKDANYSPGVGSQMYSVLDLYTEMSVSLSETLDRDGPNTLSRQVLMRGSIASFSNSLTTSRSRSSVSLSETDISVYRSASVTEIEPTAGRLFVRSRFPQYLIRAIFGCALAVARIAKILAGYVIQKDANYSPGVGSQMYSVLDPARLEEEIHIDRPPVELDLAYKS